MPKIKNKGGFFLFWFFVYFSQNMFFQGLRNVSKKVEKFKKNYASVPVGSEGVSSTLSKPFLVFFSCPPFSAKPPLTHCAAAAVCAAVHGGCGCGRELHIPVPHVQSVHKFLSG